MEQQQPSEVWDFSGDTEAIYLFHSRNVGTQIENAKLQVKSLFSIYVKYNIEFYHSAGAILQDPEMDDREKVRQVYGMMKKVRTKADEIFKDCTKKVKKDPDLC